mmetsp:Transcript_797/g.1545  ORF Transcript_797/g.1545 Transcript_797/m.1545 type:complete len:112 (-) Transcript_797:75-410(-)|eukprot:CAMPEP_0202712266 /NCGR_PEP_ID=MMETSP1385-20130828/36157_1 /ASSEMBLY_ACC=CAM_ASM_000861 /TAXON_ID=933848 /ORGANISM="Elphidium margaritaceum" /LENGTH=111 /DNA_ID=CAMNT_0049372241 /DNA_START=31 /DNA_END=366 /DNA_ORIENTATION=+
MAAPAQQEEAPPGYTIKGYEKTLLHTYNINGKQIKDEMELTVNDSVTNKTWYKKFMQSEFETAIKDVYEKIKQCNANDQISFTFPDTDPDNGSLSMNVNKEFSLQLLPKKN